MLTLFDIYRYTDNHCCYYCSGVAWNRDKRNHPICDNCLRKINLGKKIKPFYGYCAKCNHSLYPFGRFSKILKKFICLECFNND